MNTGGPVGVVDPPEIVDADYHRSGFEAYMLRGHPRNVSIVAKLEGSTRDREYVLHETEARWRTWRAAIEVERGSHVRTVAGTAT